ncbi:BT_3044 domain-containing protein [Sphingobacterium bovistauri]|uniref:DUF4361 domain-containing protein n=1 Tax=Sphingobacterium bovistauri TaxID=2781959 RepID=A0ABS7Z0P4_9SPHI|nr:DUF4361 domain-containing protein [Sphingobacterium bovistauri]MCA5003742.1 DUF4361 domain-containing protein [Sphingobacterium bovistauri]
MKRRISVLLSLPFFLFSCNDKDVFEQEMYKNVVALISSSYHNNFEEIVPLNGEEVLGYITASVGGSYAPKSDLTINLVQDTIPFDRYNWSLYDADTKLYAKLLAKDKYEIPSSQIIIKAGERTGRALVKLRPEGLSPDSTYFISLQAMAENGIEINSKKSNVLYKVMIYNQYASQATNSFYTMSGLQDGAITAASKQLFPLSKNSVRVIAGIESFASNEESIAKTSMMLEVGADNSVTIKPYKDLVIRQIDNDTRYPNVFKVEESFGRKFNVFSLCYEYKVGNTTKLMQEELRMEVRD